VRSLNIRCSQSAEGVELAILGDITPGTAEEIMRAVSYFPSQPITITMMSGGGDAFSSLGLYDYLKGKDITVRVYGIAASGAAIITAAARRVEMAASAFLMIHNAFGPTDGDGQSVLDSINARQADVFAARTGMSRGKVSKMLEAETFMDAQTAKANGFVDAVFDPMKMAASLNTMQSMEDIVKQAEAPEPVAEQLGEALEETTAQVTPQVTPQVEATEDPGDEQVEVEIPITTGEAIKAALAGKFKAKVNISATYGKVIGELTDELRTVRASLDEANAQVEALAPKAAEAEAATAKAAEAEAKVAEVVKEVETLKATPIEEPVKATSDANGVVPAGTAPKPTKASETAQAMARSMERLDRVLGIQKN
jgi:ATP-dependent protease ClpP protease subunit